MRKRQKKTRLCSRITILSAIGLICMLLAGCELFTNPILPEALMRFAPSAEDLSSLPTAELESAIQNSDTFDRLTSDPVASKAVLEAFGTKDQDEILALSDEAKTNIIALTTPAICNVSELIETVADCLSSDSEPDMEGILENVFEAVTNVDTTASAYILEEYVDDLAEDAEITDTNVILAAVTMALSACKENEDSIEDLINGIVPDDSGNNSITNVSQFVETVLGSTASESSIYSMTVAVEVLLRVDFDNLGNALLGSIGGNA